MSPLQVPYEALKRTSRDRKYAIEDLQDVERAVKELASRECSEEERLQALNALILKLHQLQKSVGAPTLKQNVTVF